MKNVLRFLDSTGLVLDTRSFLKFWHFQYQFLIKRFLIKKLVLDFHISCFYKLGFCVMFRLHLSKINSIAIILTTFCRIWVGNTEKKYACIASTRHQATDWQGKNVKSPRKERLLFRDKKSTYNICNRKCIRQWHEIQYFTMVAKKSYS